MSTDHILQLTYLILLGAAIGGSFLITNRQSMSKTAQQAAIWFLIFVGMIGAYGLWDDIQGDISPRQSVLAEGEIAVPVSPDGHYYLTLDINGAPVRFVVDTGASQVVLSNRDARRVGIDTETLLFTGRAFTANGVVQTAPVTLETVSLGPVTDQNLPAVVNGGDMDASLLGMTYLGRYDRIEIRNNELVLTR